MYKYNELNKYLLRFGMLLSNKQSEVVIINEYPTWVLINVEYMGFVMLYNMLMENGNNYKKNYSYVKLLDIYVNIGNYPNGSMDWFKLNTENFDRNGYIGGSLEE